MPPHDGRWRRTGRESAPRNDLWTSTLTYFLTRTGVTVDGVPDPDDLIPTGRAMIARPLALPIATAFTKCVWPMRGSPVASPLTASQIRTVSSSWRSADRAAGGAADRDRGDPPVWQVRGLADRSYAGSATADRVSLWSAGVHGFSGQRVSRMMRR